LWIIDQLDQRVGVRFADDPDVLLAMDSSAGAHDPARDLIWRRPANGPRVFEKKSGLHLARAVLDRFGNLVTADPTDSVKSPYDPVNLGEFLVAGLPAPGIEVESYPYQQP